MIWHAPQFRAYAVARAHKLGTATVARELRISAGLLQGWIDDDAAELEVPVGVRTRARGAARRARGHLALRLVRPFLDAEVEWTTSHWQSGHVPQGYHQDWWPGGFFAIDRLERRMRHGHTVGDRPA